MRTKLKQDDETTELMEDRNRVCTLCNRKDPIIFYGNEENIKRLPERALTKLMQDMKTDLENKVNYLKAMRTS